MSDEHLGVDMEVNLTTAATGDVELVQGRKCLAQDVCDRLTTPRGDLWCHQEWGLDIYRFLHLEDTALNRMDLEQAVEEEVQNDPRVDTVQAEVASWDGRKITVQVSLTSIDGGNPINLVIGYDLATITAEVISGGY